MKLQVYIKSTAIIIKDITKLEKYLNSFGDAKGKVLLSNIFNRVLILRGELIKDEQRAKSTANKKRIRA